ncbi:uncharacterized protein LOC117579785 [Drosophila guanche]|uniref:Uncharacterized protein n=1 Tax=Drosophila guanche TaxID=7266 RepID=A0A3B0JMJ1_DROGU|nr:uncharacterized protein LOC117579785 [Drosophila guanche]SPP76690.1 Hypothetical predicted protein [Drosophila guanche]
MINALNAFGLAIGWMDILGVLVFELMIFYLLRSRSHQSELNDVEQPTAEGNAKPTLRGLLGHRYLKESTKTWIFWAYLFLLNVWIVVTLLMIAGITWHKPELMLCWLIWCLAGLLLDLFFVLWWLFELCAGDAIEALTNIIISMLTMVIEFGFIYVIYTIYANMSNSEDEADAHSDLFAIVKSALDPRQWMAIFIP